MKNILIIAAALFVFSTSAIYSQTVDGIPVKDVDMEYIQIVGVQNLFNRKLKVHFDFGQEVSSWREAEKQILDDQGKEINFNSMIEALNFMHKNGYELVNSYIEYHENRPSHYYILRKIASEKE